MERTAGVFGAAVVSETPPVELKALHADAKIGQPTLERGFPEGALGKAGLLFAPSAAAPR